MKWDEIKEKYPKCCRLSWDYQILDFKYGTDRRLYDFFDGQGIYGSVLNSGGYFQYRIENKYIEPVNIIKTQCGPKSRTETKDKKFEKKFEFFKDKQKW